MFEHEENSSPHVDLHLAKEEEGLCFNSWICLVKDEEVEQFAC